MFQMGELSYLLTCKIKPGLFQSCYTVISPGQKIRHNNIQSITAIRTPPSLPPTPFIIERKKLKDS